MLKAAAGSIVTISYIGTLDSGRIFHSTEAGGPVVATIGKDQLFPALEAAIIGMTAGQTKNVVLSAEEAYGARLPENITQLPMDAFPAGKAVTIGQKLGIEFKGGTSMVALVTGVSETHVTLDANHPLAGCELTFALRVEHVETSPKDGI